MITYIEVLDAVNVVNGNKEPNTRGWPLDQLEMALQVYKDRGEFDGTMESAIECLQLAGFEVQS